MTELQQFVSEIPAQVNRAKVAPPSAPASIKAPSCDLVAELERLAALHQSGALTEAEFAAAKQKLLGG